MYNLILKMRFKNNSLHKLFILNLKLVYSTTSSRLVIFITPIIITIALAALLPIQWFLIFGTTFCIPVSAGTVFGITYFPLRTSNLYSNIITTNSKLISLYFSIILIMMFVTLISVIEFILTSFIFLKLGIANTSMISIIIGNTKFNFINIEWGVVVYYWIISNLFIFVISLFSKLFIQKQKTFFLFLVIFLIFQIPFGGLLPSSFGLYNGKWSLTPKGGISLTSWYGVWNFYTIISIINPLASLNFLIYDAYGSGVVDSDASKHLAMSISNCSWLWEFIIFYPPIFVIISKFIVFFTLNK